MSESNRVAIIGAGPAGLMAAEILTDKGIGVDIYDAMPSVGRKFLMAGKSGLNITHSEPTDIFLNRYGDNQRLIEMVSQFGSQDIIKWMADLGIEAHTGSTGRIFPVMMKSSPLLRAWLMRLGERGAVLHTKHRWQGWNDLGGLIFDTPEGIRTSSPTATIFAMGGGSWKRLGSDGKWADIFNKQSLETIPFEPSNSGFLINWSDKIKQDFAGAPVKSIRVGLGQDLISGEFVVTEKGVESGAIYTLSAKIREQIKAYGSAKLIIDLLPHMSEQDILNKLSRPRGKQSLSNYLRKTVKLSGVKLALLYEEIDKAVLQDMEKLAWRIKSLPLTITGTANLDEAISTTGGVDWEALDENLMLKDYPGNYCAGEMIDWDAPTGGYLITACLATGRIAGLGAAARILEQ
ncbi:TIGR03862 family flavoprotein [Hirschia baltica]|uniref:HI0933 family protein n=1 Tax=Hirschia baltica (strain ATCC 49814 / DSM 5838 / IFAM 1418) TaxID=582402 RepID=C6XNM1_HIRBI|nr:TIGR03862 family flavoprotein [Hirschia baltica]ACT58274.1 HI0933 family protein [Hirschia baltica ATCC 49814]